MSGFESFAGPLLGIGLGTSLIGGLLGSSAARSQAQAQLAADRENRQFTDNKLTLGYANTLRNVLGAGQAESILRSNGMGEQVFGRPAKAAGFTPDQQAQLDRLNMAIAQQGGTVTRNNRGQPNPQLADLVRQRDALLAVTGGDPGSKGLMTLEDFRSGGPGVIDQMNELASSFGKQGQNVLGQFDADTAQLAERGRKMEGAAAQFGANERKRVTNEADKALKSANRTTESRLVARGLGSGTVLTGALGQNARNVEEVKQNALGQIGDKQLAFMSGLQGQNLNMLAGRAGQRAPIMIDNLTRDLMLKKDPIDLQTQIFTGGVANPWTGRDTRFMSGVSPSGAAMGSMAGMLGAAGGQATNFGMLGLMAQDPSFKALFGR